MFLSVRPSEKRSPEENGWPGWPTSATGAERAGCRRAWAQTLSVAFGSVDVVYPQDWLLRESGEHGNEGGKTSHWGNRHGATGLFSLQSGAMLSPSCHIRWCWCCGWELLPPPQTLGRYPRRNWLYTLSSLGRASKVCSVTTTEAPYLVHLAATVG